MKNILLLFIILLGSKSLSEISSVNSCEPTIANFITPARRAISSPHVEVKKPQPNHKNRQFIETVYNIETFTPANRYISIEGTPAQIIEIDEQGRLIIEEGLWTKKRRKINKLELKFAISSVRFEPALRVFFQNQENFPREVEAFNIPRTHEERTLQSEGFTPAFYSGVDAVLYWNQVGQKMKAGFINPYQTHIEEFAHHVNGHITFMKEGILNRTDISQELKNEMLALLNQFFEEAQQKIKDKELTYAYWLYWNQRLAILASPTIYNKIKNTYSNTLTWQESWWRTDTSIHSLKIREQLKHFLSKENVFYYSIWEIQNILDKFPNEIAFHIPGPLGAIALVEASPNAIPLSLRHSISTTEGFTMNAVQQTHHDYIHYFAGFGTSEWPHIIQSPISKERFKQAFKEKIRALDRHQKRQAYIGMFLLMHDFPLDVNIQKPKNILRIFKINKRAFKNKNNLGNLLPEELLSFIQSDVKSLGNWISSVGKEQRQALKQYLEESAAVFNNIINQILAEHP